MIKEINFEELLPKMPKGVWILADDNLFTWEELMKHWRFLIDEPVAETPETPKPIGRGRRSHKDRILEMWNAGVKDIDEIVRRTDIKKETVKKVIEEVKAE